MYWDTIRQRIRQQEIPIGKERSWVRRLVLISVPVLAVCIALFVLFTKPPETIEMIVPVADMLEDEDIAAITLYRMSHEDLIEDFTVIEESLPFDIDDAFSDMTSEEKELFIELITRKNGIGI